MDRDIRTFHHVRCHALVSAYSMVPRSHLSRTTRPVSGSTPLWSLRDRSWNSSCKNKQIYPDRRGFRRLFNAPSLRVSLATPLSILRQDTAVSDGSRLGDFLPDLRRPRTRPPQETKRWSAEAFQSQTRLHRTRVMRLAPSLP